MEKLIFKVNSVFRGIMTWRFRTKPEEEDCKKIKPKNKNKFYTLKIKEVIRETPEAVSISFEVPPDLKEKFEYKAGQYITLRTTSDGKEVRRAYSLCSAPGSEEYKVTVKEVKGGTFSGLANNILKAGDLLEVHPPEGKFVFEPGNNSAIYAAFAAGSGITPVLSIIKTMLTAEPLSKFVLVYGNKTKETTIFYQELLELQAKFPGRLFIEFIYSQTQVENAHFGRIEGSTVTYILNEKFKEFSFKLFYLCGPEEMINNINSILEQKGIFKKNIHFEFFTVKQTSNIDAAVEGNVKLTIIVDDVETVITMDGKKTVLDAALENDLNVPYSCQEGSCSSCVARIREGKAEMRQNLILTAGEIAKGLILTCQAQATTPILKVDYDV